MKYEIAIKIDCGKNTCKGCQHYTQEDFDQDPVCAFFGLLEVANGRILRNQCCIEWARAVDPPESTQECKPKPKRCPRCGDFLEQVWVCPYCGLEESTTRQCRKEPQNG